MKRSIYELPLAERQAIRRRRRKKQKIAKIKFLITLSVVSVVAIALLIAYLVFGYDVIKTAIIGTDRSIAEVARFSIFSGITIVLIGCVVELYNRLVG